MKVPAQTYRGYSSRWTIPAYKNRVKAEAAWIGSDGCSGVPDFYWIVCLEHDIHYATHRDFLTGAPLTKEDADRYLRWGIQYHSSLGRQSPMALWRWWALSKKKGMGLGSRAWETGPERMKRRLALAESQPHKNPWNEWSASA
ncbi:hypothetical protein LCGC14_0485770 [marine sediment metagenome]|uniref:Uncharacterized protein n=1 Tax=marine sediment metagenome TaxID=412755 RepID=A0A0F9S7Y0_9ZZZZ